MSNSSGGAVTAELPAESVEIDQVMVQEDELKTEEYLNQLRGSVSMSAVPVTFETYSNTKASKVIDV